MIVATSKTEMVLLKEALKCNPASRPSAAMISKARQLKYLSVLIDEKQNFYSHIEKTLAKETSLI